MPYSLRRTRDGAGDSGGMSLAITKEGEILNNSRPIVGAAMRVGAAYARSYSMQDYWQTTPITNITLDTPEEVHFETGNSSYVWKVI